jgi:hypothetical protein
MKRRLAFVLLAWMLAACALPFDAPSSQQVVPTAAAPAPTEAPSQAPAPTDAPTAAAQPATPAPTAPQATAAPGQPIGTLESPARIDAADPAPRDQVELAEAFKGGDIPDVARTTPLDVKLGDVETFWVSDNANDTNYQVQAELRYVGDIVLMYVDTSVSVEQADIERSAREFEERIYPRDRELFGEELSPGIDGDPRLTILNTAVRGAGGYFSSTDSVVKAVNRFSNEREMFVIGIDGYPIGTDSYASTLAHEFQHMIEWNVARRSPSWFNEGMSTLAEDLNGYISHGTAGAYLVDPDLQLITWSGDAAMVGDHYGASHLFMRYFYNQYAGEDGLAELISADAGNNLDAFVTIAARKRPDITSFADIYADWTIANVLNDASIGDGRFAYDLMPKDAGPAAMEIESKANTTVSQFGVDYYGVLQGPMTIEFDGAETVGLVGADPKEGRFAWWSNRGDDSVETLTRAFDLSGVQQATLQFSAWYEIEKDWDYGFVTVSTDGGKSWITLKGTTTTDYDPQGANFGNGLTGVSGSPDAETDKGTRGQWVEERMDLAPFAGKQILLRFWVVNDAAYNAQGLLLDNIRIPELNYSDGGESGDGGWEAQGFIRTTAEMAQTWALRLVRAKDGNIAVEQPAVDAEGRATVRLEDGERAIFAVIGTTPFTTEPATYSYTSATP